MTRVLVLGGRGMLGHKLCQLLPDHGCEVTATVRGDADDCTPYAAAFKRAVLLSRVNVLDEPALDEAVRQANPEVIVNCVGIVKQLPEARDPYLSVGINSFLPHRLARLCAMRQRRLIHVSSDCVFSGAKGMYLQSDPSDADDLYGKSKHLGETGTTETAALTLRTSIIGRELSQPGHGLLEWFLAQQGRSVRGFSQAIFSGLSTHELARVIAAVIHEHPRLCGLRHVASTPINKFDLLCLLRDTYGMDIDICREETPRCDRSLVMDQFTEETGYRAPSWEAMVREMHRDPTPYDVWNTATGGPAPPATPPSAHSAADSRRR